MVKTDLDLASWALVKVYIIRNESCLDGKLIDDITGDIIQYAHRLSNLLDLGCRNAWRKATTWTFRERSWKYSGTQKKEPATCVDNLEQIVEEGVEMLLQYMSDNLKTPEFRQGDRRCFSPLPNTIRNLCTTALKRRCDRLALTLRKDSLTEKPFWMTAARRMAVNYGDSVRPILHTLVSEGSETKFRGGWETKASASGSGSAQAQTVAWTRPSGSHFSDSWI